MCRFKVNSVILMSICRNLFFLFKPFCWPFCHKSWCFLLVDGTEDHFSKKINNRSWNRLLIPLVILVQLCLPPHPSRANSTARYNDIALLMTYETIQFNDAVFPYCIPDEEPPAGTIVTVSGFGLYNASKTPFTIFFSTSFTVSLSSPYSPSSFFLSSFKESS